MNEMLVLATLAARHIVALERELEEARAENAALKAERGPRPVEGQKESTDAS